MLLHDRHSKIKIKYHILFHFCFIVKRNTSETKVRGDIRTLYIIRRPIFRRTDQWSKFLIWSLLSLGSESKQSIRLIDYLHSSVIHVCELRREKKWQRANDVAEFSPHNLFWKQEISPGCLVALFLLGLFLEKISLTHCANQPSDGRVDKVFSFIWFSIVCRCSQTHNFNKLFSVTTHIIRYIACGDKPLRLKALNYTYIRCVWNADTESWTKIARCLVMAWPEQLLG